MEEDKQRHDLEAKNERREQVQEGFRQEVSEKTVNYERHYKSHYK